MKKNFTFRSTLAAAATIALLATAATTTQAAVLYSSPADYTQPSFGSTTDPGGPGGGEQECTAFTLSTDATITQVSFWGDYFDTSLPTDSFTIRLYLGATTPDPTALVATGTTALTRVDTGLQGARGLETYFYTATLATPFVVSGATGYSVAVLNAVNTWDWQFGGAGTNFYRTGGEGTDWITSAFPNEDSIQLIGDAVPEPSTWALLGLGVFGAGVVTLRRRRVA